MMNSKTYFVNSKTYSVPTEPARDTVGAIMWDRPVVLPPLARINEAIERLRQVGLPHPSMNSCYVVAEDYTLLGVLGLRDMLLTRGGVRVEAAMTRPFATIQPEDDQELAAQLMEAFDLLELPVVDKDNRLVGVVTADEAMGVLQEEATEDMEMMAAITPSERPYLDTPVWRIFASRIPWLLLLMLSAAFTGAIIQHFEAALAAQVAKKGNCRVWATSYIGTGTCGMNGPTSVTFPEKPLFAMILTPGSIEIAWITPGNGFLVYSKSNQLTWSGNTASWFHDYPNGEPQNQLNYKGSRYNVLAFFMTDK